MGIGSFSIAKTGWGAYYPRAAKMHGLLAQLVEQGIENPCVPGSIPG